MTREEQLKFCSVCVNRSFNPQFGIICRLTNEKADFAVRCENYVEDPKEIMIEERKKTAQKQEKKGNLNKARIALFIIGGLYVLVGFLEGFVIAGHDIIFGIVDWVVAGIFVGLGVWSYKEPSKALITGLIVYLAIMVLLAIVEPLSIFKGIIWKVLIIYYLVHGIKTAHEDEKKNKVKQANLLDDF
jgi:hypothetical protein